MLDFTTWTLTDPLSECEVSETTASMKIRMGSDVINFFGDYGEGGIETDFEHTFKVDVTESVQDPTMPNGCYMWGLQQEMLNGVVTDQADVIDYPGAMVHSEFFEGGVLHELLFNGTWEYDGISDTGVSTRWWTIDHTYPYLTMEIYSDEARSTLIDSYSLDLTTYFGFADGEPQTWDDGETFRYIVGPSSADFEHDNTKYIEVDFSDYSIGDDGGDEPGGDGPGPDPTAAGDVHIVNLNLMKTLNGSILLNNATIGQVLRSDLNIRVIPDNDVPNSLAHPTIKEYLEAEEDDGYRLLELNQTYIITAQN